MVKKPMDKTTTKSGNVTCGVKVIIISGGNAYGISIPVEYRVAHSKDDEQASVNAWNTAMAAEAATRADDAPGEHD